LRAAVLFGGLAQATAITLLAAAGVEPWRLVGLAVAFVGFAIAERIWVGALEHGCDVDAACGRTIVVALLAQIACMAVTGGVASPFLVSAVLPALMPLVLFGPIAVSRGSVVLSIVLMIGVALLPEAITGGTVPLRTFVWVAVAAHASFLLLVYDTIRRIASVTKSSRDQVESLRVGRLAAVEKRSRTLRSFRASLEDELRNPLTVIKALVQLVARNPAAERTDERLGVVTGEVARIERTISEYLTFQRAVDCLDVVEVDVSALASDAIDTARRCAGAANLTFDLLLRPVRARLDADRLADALIEVLSSAIATALPGSIIAVATFPADSSAVIKISITGARRQRPSPPRLEGTFAALVVAQHGGELVCVPESERAVAITLTLPTEPKRCDRPRACLD
jgi:signal transduction histidine kinase